MKKGENKLTSAKYNSNRSYFIGTNFVCLTQSKLVNSKSSGLEILFRSIENSNYKEVEIRIYTLSKKSSIKLFFYYQTFVCVKGTFPYAHKTNVPGHVAQLVTCLTTDTCLTADLAVASSIPAWSHTFVEIDHELISTAILLLSADSRRVVVKYVHEVLVNRFVKVAQEEKVVR